MTAWNGGSLTDEQTPHPVLWHARIDEFGYSLSSLPTFSSKWFHAFWGDAKTTRRLRTWGHKDKGDKYGPHFLCTRGGTPYHTDPGYGRYCLQVQVYNQGYLVHGLGDDIKRMPLFTPGLVILLDTWSPHRVARDPRMPQRGLNKVLAGSDFPEKPDIAVELPKIMEHIPSLRLP